MLETIGYILWLVLCYLAGYMLGLCLAEWINSTEWKQENFA